jgi:hypothetical protein
VKVVGDLLRRPSAGGEGVDVENLVALPHAAPFGGRVREHLADRDRALEILDLHADPGVLAVGLLREVGELLGREELAVGVVQLLHEPLGRLLVERGGADGVDVTLRHEGEDLVQHARPIRRGAVLYEKAPGDDR